MENSPSQNHGEDDQEIQLACGPWIHPASEMGPDSSAIKRNNTVFAVTQKKWSWHRDSPLIPPYLSTPYTSPHSRSDSFRLFYRENLLYDRSCSFSHRCSTSEIPLVVARCKNMLVLNNLFLLQCGKTNKQRQQPYPTGIKYGSHSQQKPLFPAFWSPNLYFASIDYVITRSPIRDYTRYSLGLETSWWRSRCRQNNLLGGSRSSIPNRSGTSFF